MNDIYPADLIAERSGDDNKAVEYLDIKLKITTSGFHALVFHKVDNIVCLVILLTFPNNLIPYKMIVNVMQGR